MVQARERGYTVRELVVATAMLLIVAALTMPSFARARSAARTSACLSNAKQIALAVLCYTQDYDEALPYAYHQASCCGPTWRVDMLPYLSGREVWRCPNDQRSDLGFADGASVWPGPDCHAWSSYVANTVHSQPGGPVPFFGTEQSGLQGDPPLTGGDYPRARRRAWESEAPALWAAEWLMFAESTREPFMFGYRSRSAMTNEHVFDHAADPGSRRHRGGSVYAWADGHAAWRSPARCGNRPGIGDCPWSAVLTDRRQGDSLPQGAG